MRKDFGPKAIITPLPVLIIATYNEDGTPNAMNAAWGGPKGRRPDSDLPRNKPQDDREHQKAQSLYREFRYAENGNRFGLFRYRQRKQAFR